MRYYYNYFAPRFHAKASHIFAVSEYTRQDILKQYPNISPSKVSVTYNACNESEYFPLLEIEKQHIKAQFSDGKSYFLYVGSVHPRKNLLNLLKGFEIFKESNPQSDILLVIAGRIAWKTGEMRDFYQNMRFRESVKFLQFVPQTDLPRLIASAYALCYVSLFEGFGIPILEAMHCEIPVLTSNTSSMPEVAADAALLIDPQNPQEIANALHRLYSDESLCKQLIERGKNRREAFNWDVSAAHIYTILSSFQLSSR